MNEILCVYGGDRGTRKERSDGIAERNGASRFRCQIKERSGERGKVRNKKRAANVPLIFGSLQAEARSAGGDRGTRTRDLCDVNTAL